MSDKPINLARELNDARYTNPEDTLRDILENDIGKRGAFKHGKKLLVIGLDDVNGAYNVSFTQAGMTMSESLALVEVARQLFLRQMGYALTVEDTQI